MNTITSATVLKAGSQLEYLAKQIKSHHSSSPESVLEALKSLSKGTKAVIHEMDIDTQVVAELSKSCGQEGSAQGNERRCGACGKTGHNARTCQIVISISSEKSGN
ncbi:Uncharacterized protein HZ326_25590 [Fusarium oxysporum f. sp. albedinis]|nr:Uncharacterized protein HZ326_25590 [Fusarium oxysporum f. sp. albedinis]